MPGGLAQGLGQEDGGGPDPDPGHGDIGPLSVQGDELPGQVR